MRYVVVVLLALAGCGGEGRAQGGASAQCAAAVVYHDTSYVRAQGGPKPALGGRLTVGFVPACNDHEGDPGTDAPVALRRIKGTAPTVAVYSRKPFPGVYYRADPQP